MQTTQYLSEILNELKPAVTFIADEEAENLANKILNSNKIFVAGAGRSGLMIKSFAMRLMQMGFEVYVVGETVTPNLEKDDLLIIGSGSGGTKSLVSVAEKAKSIGGHIALITISPDSTLGQLADNTLQLPGIPKDKSGSEDKTIQPMGALFEQTLLLFLDAMILRLMRKKGMDGVEMFGKHANLE